MSLTLTTPYDNAANFTFDPAKIEISGGAARLKMENVATTPFSEDFADDTGFTYDSAKAEFTGGLVRVKDQRPTGATFHASFTNSLDGNWGGGVLTCTPTGGPTISGGYVDLTGQTKSLAFVTVGNVSPLVQTGCVRIKFKTAHSGTPATACNLFTISTGGTAPNLIHVFQNTAGQLQALIFDSAGNAIVNATFGVWSPVAGVEYTGELDFDINAVVAATRFFFDGTQFGSTYTNAGTRTSGATNFEIGRNYTGAYRTNIYVGSITCFSTVQHTANHALDAEMPETIYAETAVTLPAYSYAGVGVLQSFGATTATEVGAPRWSLNGYYWNGAAWASTANTYATAMTLAQWLANVATFPVTSATTITPKLYFPTGNTLASVSQLDFTVTGQDYPSTDPSITPNSSQLLDGIDNLVATDTSGAGYGVKYILSVDGVLKWWNGTAWATSAGTYAQSNTVAEIVANRATAPLALGVNLKIVSVLHYTTGGGTSPTLTETELDYNYYGPVPPTPVKTYCYLRVMDILGASFAGATLSAVPDAPYWDTNRLVPAIKKSATSDANGYVELYLEETATEQQTVTFSLAYTDPNTQKAAAVNFEPVVIPATASVDLSTLLTIT